MPAILAHGFSKNVGSILNFWLPRLPSDLGVKGPNFLSLWKGVLKANEVSVFQKLTRPSSSAISRWLVCYKLRYSPTRLKELDAVILRIAGRQLVTSQDVAAFNPQVER